MLLSQHPGRDTEGIGLYRRDRTFYRRDRTARGGGVFICVKNIIASTELWVDEDF